MKKFILRVGMAFLALGAAVLWLSCQRSSLSTTRRPATETVQADASNVTRQSASRVSPQAEAKPTSEEPPAEVPDADIEKEDALWKETPEYKAFEDELQRIFDTAEARGANSPFTSNEVAALITYMQNPHPRARGEAVALAMGSSESAKPMVLPYVLSLLSDPVWRVRRQAASTLGEIGDKSMIPYLEPLLNDRPEVARPTQRAISRLQQKDTSPKGG
jgi:hypothetical protein